MALKLDITDEKGVKARYHAIRSFAYEQGKIKVKLHSYVNQATRDSEKNAITQNIEAEAYEAELNDLRAELDTCIGKTDEESITRLAELTTIINEKTLNPERPQFTDVIDRHYAEDEVTVNYVEPVTLEALYVKLVSEGRYAGAENI